MLNIFNGYDLKESFNTIIPNVISQLWALPDRKPSEQNDFQDEDGLNIDLSQPKFSARTFTFNCITSSKNYGTDAEMISDLNKNYFSFFKLLRIGGSYPFFNDYTNLTVNIYYQKQGSLSGIYNNNEGGKSIKYDLQFGEIDPLSNIPLIFLVDDVNRYLIP